MTSTQKKKILEAYILLNDSINNDIDEIARIKSRAKKLSANTSDDSDFSESEKEIQIDKTSICARQSIVNKKIETLVKLRLKIEQSASQLSDRRLSLLIKYRYIDGLGWDEISEKLYLSEKSNQIFVLHNKALNEFELD